MTRESEQAAHDCGDAPALVNDPLNHLPLEVAPVRPLVLQELCEVDDAVQRIVYLVRHARRQLAERGELRRLIELLPHLLALGLEAAACREVADDEDYQALFVRRERVE